MSLKYTLVKNPFSKAPTAKKTAEYVFRVYDQESLDLEQCIKRIAAKGNHSHSVAVSMLEEFFDVITEATQEGKKLNLPILKTSASIPGTVADAVDHLDKKKNVVQVNMTPGQRLKDAAAQAHATRVEAPQNLPHILEVKDGISGSINQQISSAGVIEIIGTLLKIQGESPQNGITLTGSTGKLHKIETIVENNPSKLIVMLPKLEKGEYTLQVTTQYVRGMQPAKTPRTGTFETSLTVI